MQAAPLCCQTTPHLVCIPISSQIVQLVMMAMNQELTLSQSSFERVNGNALLKLLKVFSNISWYASLRDTWYLLSSSSTSASIFEAAGWSPEVIPGGKLKVTSCVAMSCTWWLIHENAPRTTNRTTHVSLFVIMHMDRNIPCYGAMVESNRILRPPTTRPDLMMVVKKA